jgi:hypothetical protein
MPVTETSYASYRELLHSGVLAGQQYKIISTMREGVTYSRRELMRLTGIEINAITGRVNELVKVGALVEMPPKTDPETRKLVSTVALNTGERQMPLI